MVDHQKVEMLEMEVENNVDFQTQEVFHPETVNSDPKEEASTNIIHKRYLKRKEEHHALLEADHHHPKSILSHTTEVNTEADQDQEAKDPDKETLNLR